VYLSFMRSWAVFFVLMAALPAMGQSKPYPKPQVPAAVAHLAPDLILKDQDGKNFHLADQRGHWAAPLLLSLVLVTVLHD
jgi:cytochrome oxidase Cu insertion factor (SCO1/SenC/PrrC family)